MTHWAIMPYLGNVEQTAQAIEDVLAQDIPGGVQLLLIDQGSPQPVGIRAEVVPSVFRWRHDPPLLSLSATWNHALRAVWMAGGDEAWVVNNDIRCVPQTYRLLSEVRREADALFTTAYGVTEQEYVTRNWAPVIPMQGGQPMYTGGPDFSCFVIAKACHERYPFDEGFQPAYCEDLDYHRRVLLAGEGKRIFSIHLPYLHYASGTLKGMSPTVRAQWEEQISTGSRAYYEKKWGGGVNQERYRVPWDVGSAQDGVTTPELQRKG